ASPRRPPRSNAASSAASTSAPSARWWWARSCSSMRATASSTRRPSGSRRSSTAPSVGCLRTATAAPASASTCLSPIEAHPPDRHRDGGLRGLDHGNADLLLQRLAVARHAGAAHHHDVRTVPLAQGLADLHHPAERFPLIGQLDDRNADRQLAGKALAHAERTDVAQVARDRLLQDGDDAE